MVQVGKTKDQGLYNNPSAAVHLGALAAGTLPQCNDACNRDRTFKLNSFAVEEGTFVLGTPDQDYEWGWGWGSVAVLLLLHALIYVS